MKNIKVILGAVAGVFAIYFFAAPYITVYQMKSAAQKHDGEALSEYVEFPSVRQSLKDQMNAMFTKKMEEDDKLKNNAFASFGAAIAGMVVDKMVDAYVTPAGLIRLMAGDKPLPQRDDSTSNSTPNLLPDASMSYESIDKFVVKVKNKDGGEGRFVLRRRGLGWKLTDIVAPLS